MSHLVALFVTVLTVRAQSLVEPQRVAEVSRTFDGSLAAAPLRCEISPVRPALTFGFRFQTGYRLGLPLVQFKGPGHRLTVNVRVAPEGHAPVYLASVMALPDVPDTKGDLVADGMFVVGEGSYQLSLLVIDDQDRACRSAWQIQAQRTGNERQLVQAMPPGAVADLNSTDRSAPAETKPQDIAKLTILLHASSLSPNRPKLLPDDVALLTESVSSLLRQWPARSVRLVAFNLDQRSVIWRNDKFDAGKMDELTSQLERMELAAINYRVLQGGNSPIDVLAGLLSHELEDPQPPAAVLLIGPRTRRFGDTSQFNDKPPRRVPLFYLQYLPRQAFIPGAAGPYGGRAETMGDAQFRGPYPVGPDATSSIPPLVFGGAQIDPIQHLVSRLKGETIAIRTPHDLAGAIHRIDPLIARTAPPPAAAPAPETAPVEITQPSLPAAASRSVVEPPIASEQDPIGVLAKLRDRVLKNGLTIPNHTCVETVQRSRYNHTGEPLKSCDTILAARRQSGDARLRLATTDRLRLDVALSTEREIYSWAGAGKFEEGDIDELVPQGAIGTGPFASMLLSVFIGRPPRFTFEGDTTIKSQVVYEYSFRVPRAESHFRFKAHQQWMITGYGGSLFVDPQTSDLIRLIVRTEELPPETETCEVDTTLDYGRVQLSSGTFFLPSSTNQRFVGRDGEESENVYTFSSCRDFQAFSSVDFGGHTDESSAPMNRLTASTPWPAALPVTIELVDPIDTATAAAGDGIRGRIVRPVRDPKGAIVMPQGAAVTGRLMRVEVRHPSPQVTIALRWETLELDFHAVPLQLTPNRELKRGPGIQLGGIASLANLKRRGTQFELPLPGEEHYGVYHFPGTHYVIESGLPTEWVTTKP
jgi:hypothetical protein